MSNILGVVQLLLRTILVVVLFKVMNLVLVLRVAMGADAEAKVRECFASVVEVEKLLQGDLVVLVCVEEVEHRVGHMLAC